MPSASPSLMILTSWCATDGSAWSASCSGVVPRAAGQWPSVGVKGAGGQGGVTHVGECVWKKKRKTFKNLRPRRASRVCVRLGHQSSGRGTTTLSAPISRPRLKNYYTEEGAGGYSCTEKGWALLEHLPSFFTAFLTPGVNPTALIPPLLNP